MFILSMLDRMNMKGVTVICMYLIQADGAAKGQTFSYSASAADDLF